MIEVITDAQARKVTAVQQQPSGRILVSESPAFAWGVALLTRAEIAELARRFPVEEEA